MKTLNKPILILLLLFGQQQIKAQVGISTTTGYTPDPKAMLDISSTTKGLLIPRMTTAQRNAIIPAPSSLMVYDTDVKSYWYYDGAVWKEIGSASTAAGWALTGNAGIDPATHFIGTNDGSSLNFKTDNVQRMQIAKHGRIGIGADATENSQLFVNSKDNAYGINADLELDYLPGVVKHTYAINGINSSKRDGNRYGGYFWSSSFSYGGPVSNYGVFAYAANSATRNVALYASTFETTTHDLAAHFDKGNVKVNNTLAIGKDPSLGTQFEILKIANKNAAFIDLPVIGKNNNIYFGKNDVGTDVIGIEINMENTATNRALEVHGRSTFYDRVGVLTTTIPTGYSLAVNGKIIAEELRIQNSTLWPDYVFEKDYSLPKLTDVQRFIQINKHLPDVPSAKTVENEGIILGEMQKTLLKKVEELTLYIIDQQKQIDNLNAKFETLNPNK